MDITVQREALLRPLQAVSSIIEKKQVQPILSNVLLTRPNDNSLLLTGTDLEVKLIGKVSIASSATLLPDQESTQNASSLTSESITVSARKLFDICRTLPEGSILRLFSEKNNLVVRTENSCFTLNTLPAHDFPNLEESAYPVQFHLPQQQLKNLLTKTYFAMAQQDVRHFLNGVFIDINQGVIKCVAADGHRLALATMQDERMAAIKTQIILPRKSVLELIRLLNDNEDEVALHMSDNRFCMITPDYTFISKLINAQYPDYQRLIPKGNMMAIGDRETIKQALIRASILSNEKFRGVRFQLQVNKLCITANNADQEQAEEAIALNYAGSEIEIAFNVAYLLDIVSAIATKNIRCAFTGANEGVSIEPLEVDGEDAGVSDSTYVVMPMRL